MEMTHRPRRLRRSPVLRKMVRETRMDKSSLIYPMFVTEGTNIKQEIPTMPGQYRYSVDRLPEALEEVADAGVPSVMLFGIPDHKDACGSGAWAEDGIVATAEFWTGTMWTTTRPWTIWQKLPCPRCRRELIWWRPPT